ncbi:MAG: hypothetical protein KME54_04815 [Tolypothrix brevis GSE-NOS-MK-07-07A]|jgi:hypothetical protein|nr:hypothetical protein [Tolypothrix brevis GSE-NOS-MK-07-07A]
MSQYSLKDKAIDSYDLKKSKLLTSFESHVQIKNFGENLQPKYSRRRKTIFLADTAKSRQMCKILGYLPKIVRYRIAIGWNERYLRYASGRDGIHFIKGISGKEVKT